MPLEVASHVVAGVRLSEIVDGGLLRHVVAWIGLALDFEGIADEVGEATRARQARHLEYVLHGARPDGELEVFHLEGLEVDLVAHDVIQRDRRLKAAILNLLLFVGGRDKIDDLGTQSRRPAQVGLVGGRGGTTS